MALRVKLGSLYNAYVGNPTGHYSFEMKKKMHRIELQKMCAVSSADGFDCIELVKAINIDASQGFCNGNPVLYNTSQKGYLSSFRNEAHDYHPVDISSAWLGKKEAKYGIM